MTVAVEIAGWCFELEGPPGRECFDWPSPIWAPFETGAGRTPDVRCRIDLVKALPAWPKRPLLFDAVQGLWRMYQDGDGYLFENPHASSGIDLLRARVNRDLSEVHITMRSIRNKWSTRSGWSPHRVLNPLLEVLLQEKLAREGGALLHSSAVLAGGETLVFFGPSGAGKSTMAEFFLRKGFTVLNDERVAVRRLHHSVRAYGTPWPGSSDLWSSAHGPLAQILAIGHGGSEHVVTAMPARAMVTRLLEAAYLPHWSAEAMAGTVEFFRHLADAYGSLQLAFRRSPDIVEFLTDRFLARAG